MGVFVLMISEGTRVRVKKKKKKTCLRVIAFLKRGESVIKFAGCGNFNIVGRSRAETRCDVSRVSSRRHLTGK